MTIKIFDDLSSIIKDEKNNDYSVFDKIKDTYGTYIFQNKTSENILYIGEAKEQTLKDRVCQNFTENDTGGTFRKNYMEKENLDFKSFSKDIIGIKLIIIECPKNIIISALEAILINSLSPIYNKET